MASWVLAATVLGFFLRMASSRPEQPLVFAAWAMTSTLIGAAAWECFRRWVINRAIPRSPLAPCDRCGYELRGTPAVGAEVRCPECGITTPVVSNPAAPREP